MRGQDPESTSNDKYKARAFNLRRLDRQQNAQGFTVNEHKIIKRDN